MSLAQRESRANLMSWIGSLFFAGVGVAVGGSLATLSLVAKPVEVVKELPAEPAKGQVYYQPGAKDATRGKLWSLKRRNLMQGQAGVVTFSEEELNGWFSSVLRTDLPRDPKAIPPNWVLEGVNFRLNEGTLQAALPVTFNGFSEPMKVVIQSTGQIVPGKDRLLFRPSEVWVGSLPLHRFPGAIDFLVSKQLEDGWLPAEAVAVWKRIAEVAPTDHQLAIRLQ